MADNGRFVWYELLTSDPKGAIAFYSELIGWKTQPWETGEYTMWASSQGPLGGVMKLPEEAKKMGAPPHWMANVQVADVDATCAAIRKKGGRVYKEPDNIPKIGRFAVVADPQGAVLSVFKPLEPMKLHDPGPGEVSWNELLANDHNAAFAYYAELFGWKTFEEHDMGPMGKYLIYGVGETRLGGMFTKSKDMPMPPSWLYYVSVADVDATVERAKGMGAKLLNGPMDVPGGDRIAQLMDPQGAAFALHARVKK